MLLSQKESILEQAENVQKDPQAIKMRATRADPLCKASRLLQLLQGKLKPQRHRRHVLFQHIC